MSKKQYYYFYTSLKDISIDDSKLQVSGKDWIESAKEELLPEDMQLVNSLRFHIDNQNLVSLLSQKSDWVNGGVFSKEELEDEIKDPEHLPSYMKKFIVKVKENEREFPNLSLENELVVHYYRYLRSLPNQFLADYIAFDFNITNVIAALNARKYKLDIDNQVLLLGPESIQLKESSAADFGLVHDFDWMASVLNIFENPNLFEREKQLVAFKYQYIEEHLLYDYFSVSKVLGYYIRLALLERVTGFDAAKGKEIFQQITDKLSDANKLFQRLEL